MDQALIEFKGLNLDLGGRSIIRDLSLRVGCGEYVSLVGPNGAGKTSLLRCVLGVFKPSRGQILLKGRLLSQFSRREAARLIAYVPQDVEMPFRVSVFDFVLMGRFPHLGWMQSVRRVDEEITAEALQTSGVFEFAGRDFESLSGGEKQRVLIAAALAQEPQLMLLDEVSHFLDPRHENEVQELLIKLNSTRGISLISVTHDLNRAIFHSDRIVALKGGRLVFDGKPAQFVDNGVLEKIYGKRFLFVTHPGKEARVIVPDI